jgi:transposase
MIVDTMPDQLKLPYGLWTRKTVKELIERELKIVLAITTTGDYLRSWEYSPQKPNVINLRVFYFFYSKIIIR